MMPKDDISRISVDVKQVNTLLDDLQLSRPEFTKAVRSALRRSITIVRSAVRRGAATVTSNPDKYRKGVYLKVYKNAAGAQVNIYHPYYLDAEGKRNVFILRWLEEGTKEGIGKNGKLHGATPAKPFFTASANSAMPQARSVLGDNIIKYINIVASKRKDV